MTLLIDHYYFYYISRVNLQTAVEECTIQENSTMACTPEERIVADKKLETMNALCRLAAAYKRGVMTFQLQS